MRSFFFLFSSSFDIRRVDIQVARARLERATMTAAILNPITANKLVNASNFKPGRMQWRGAI